jgi:hypothetical protein
MEFGDQSSRHQLSTTSLGKVFPPADLANRADQCVYFFNWPKKDLRDQRDLREEKTAAN